MPIYSHDVIYKTMDAVKELLESSIPPEFEDIETGSAEVKQVFTLTLNRKDRKAGARQEAWTRGRGVDAWGWDCAGWSGGGKRYGACAGA